MQDFYLGSDMWQLLWIVLLDEREGMECRWEWNRSISHGGAEAVQYMYFYIKTTGRQNSLLNL